MLDEAYSIVGLISGVYSVYWIVKQTGIGKSLQGKRILKTKGLQNLLQRGKYFYGSTLVN